MSQNNHCLEDFRNFLFEPFVEPGAHLVTCWLVNRAVLQLWGRIWAFKMAWGKMSMAINVYNTIWSSRMDHTLKLSGNKKAVAAPVEIVPPEVTPLKDDIILDSWMDSAKCGWLLPYNHTCLCWGQRNHMYGFHHCVPRIIITFYEKFILAPSNDGVNTRTWSHYENMHLEASASICLSLPSPSKLK